MSRAVTVTLGRDGMGSETDEEDFLAWVAYVQSNLDERSGCDCTVGVRGARDVQDDRIVGDDTGAVRESIDALWDVFCTSPEEWPEHRADSDNTQDCLSLAVHGRESDRERGDA